MKRRRRRAYRNPIPLIAWGAIALAGAGAGLWWKTEQDQEAAELRRKLEAEGKGTIDIQPSPAPPAPQTVEDMTGGWSPEKMFAAHKAQYLEWISGAPKWVSFKPWAPGELGEPDDTLLYVGLGAAAVGGLLLLRR